MTFNVSAKSSLELRSICLALEVIDHSVIMGFIFEWCSEFLLIVFFFNLHFNVFSERKRAERGSPPDFRNYFSDMLNFYSFRIEAKLVS